MKQQKKNKLSFSTEVVRSLSKELSHEQLEAVGGGSILTSTRSNSKCIQSTECTG